LASYAGCVTEPLAERTGEISVIAIPASVGYSAGLKLAIERDWLRLHESGTYVKFTQTWAELFA
jgi:hypothetical protein